MKKVRICREGEDGSQDIDALEEGKAFGVIEKVFATQLKSAHLEFLGAPVAQAFQALAEVIFINKM